MKTSRTLLFACTALGADIFVAPDGAADATGTNSSPLGSIQGAVDLAVAGDTIYLRGGTYIPSSNIQIDKSGSASAPYTLMAYGDEEVVIDGEDLPGTPADLDASLPNPERGILHVQDADWWRFSRLTLINGPYGLYQRDANNNVYEHIATHDNYESGFQIQGASANNTVKYLDSYMNRDPRKNGESADGFALKEGGGEGNVLIGARLWNNVDDGLDLWEFTSPVTIRDTIAWGNGFNRWDFSPFEGDGNGFKLGGGDGAPADHVVINCIAFGNLATGFTDNSQEGDFLLSRNTAWDNGRVGFQMQSSSSTLEYNLAVGNAEGEVGLGSGQTQTGNSWQDDDDWDEDSLLSVDATLVQGERSSDGRIVASDFLLPADGASVGATTHWTVYE